MILGVFWDTLFNINAYCRNKRTNGDWFTYVLMYQAWKMFYVDNNLHFPISSANNYAWREGVTEIGNNGQKSRGKIFTV